MKLYVFIVFLLLVYLYFKNLKKRNIYEGYSDNQIDQDKDNFRTIYDRAKNITAENIAKTTNNTQVRHLRFDNWSDKNWLLDLIDKYKDNNNTNKNVHKYLSMDAIIGKLNYRKQHN